MFNLLLSTAFLFASTSNILLDIYPSGENIVFEMKQDGVIITGGYDLKTDSGIYNPLKHSDIEVGDLIVKVDNTSISSIETFTRAITKKEKVYTVPLEIKRNKSKITRNLKVFNIDNQIKTGLFVKERTLGVGTLTFIDTDNNIYGALGHEVVDNYSNNIIDVNGGSIYLEEVTNIKKGSNGNPGEKLTTTNLNNLVGDIKENTNYGIFGNLSSRNISTYACQIGSSKDVKLGRATILTTIEGNKVEEFEIEITSLKKQERQDLKGITFRITDKRLLNKSGGVYSGMSGSPIIQNNKLVGAVTHVLINDITMGYGLYIEYMYEECLEKMEIKS